MKLLAKLIILYHFASVAKCDFAIPPEMMSISPFLLHLYQVRKTSSVFFLFSTCLREQTQTMEQVFRWTHIFSEWGIMAGFNDFNNMHKMTRYYNRIVQPQFFVLLHNEQSVKEFSKATSTFNMTFAVWLVLFIHSAIHYCFNLSENIFNLRFDSKMLVICEDSYVLRQWYSLDQKQIKKVDFFTWNSLLNLTSFTHVDLYERKGNMQGLPLKVAVVTSGVFVSFDQKSKKFSGMFGELFEELARAANFTYNVKEVNKYGNLLENGSWTGAIGEVVTGSVDLALGDFSITSNRLNIVDFTIPLIQIRNRLYIKNLDIVDVKWSGYFQVFHKGIWAHIIFVLLVTPFILSIMKVRSGYNVKRLLTDNYFHVWSIMCQQSVTEMPEKYSLKLAYVVISVLSSVLLTAYSAALISFLTAVSDRAPFQTWKEFVSDGGFKLLVQANSSEYDLFTRANSPLAKKIIALMQNQALLPHNPKEGFEQICTNMKLVLFSSEVIRHTIELSIPCRVTSTDAGRTDCLAFILSKDNPFTDFINYHLQKFINNGMLSRLKHRYLKKGLTLGTEFKPVTVSKVIPLMWFIVIGMLLSIFILFVEALYSFCRKDTVFPIEQKWRKVNKRKSIFTFPRDSDRTNSRKPKR